MRSDGRAEEVSGPAALRDPIGRHRPQPHLHGAQAGEQRYSQPPGALPCCLCWFMWCLLVVQVICIDDVLGYQAL